MNERVLRKLTEIVQRPGGLSELEKLDLLGKINARGDFGIWEDPFATFWELKTRSEKGQFKGFFDPQQARNLHIIFERAFDTDTDMFLERWKQVQDRKRFPKST